MLETLSALKACPDVLARREIARKTILKLRWIGREEDAEKFSREIVRFMPGLTVAGSFETD